MFLRTLASLLGRRRFSSPRGGIPGSQAQADTLGSASHRPLRSLPIGALAAAAAGGIAALIGYSNGKESSSPSLEEATGEKKTKNAVVTDMKRRPGPVDDPAIRAKFTDEDGKVAWLQYPDYINIPRGRNITDFLMRRPEVTDHDEMIQRRVPNKGPTIKLEKNVKAEEQEVADEPAMRARFEAWMKQFGRTYKNKEEKAMRYGIFKATTIWCDKANASPRNKSNPWTLNDRADRTFEENYGPARQF